MIYSDASGKGGIVQEIDFLVNSDDGSYPIAQKTRNINRHMDNVVSLILQSDGRWQWDDSNQTDIPIGTATLVDGQQDYSLSGATFLDVTRVEIKDVNGNYNLIQPIDQRQVTGQSLTEFMKTSGKPLYYDKIGESVFLYPKPSTSQVTASAGIKVYFQRPPSYFTVADTTKTPGFAPIFHRILSIGPALDFAIANEMVTKVNILSAQLSKLEAGIVQHYSARNKDENVRMRTRSENYGAEEGVQEGYAVSDKMAF